MVGDIIRSFAIPDHEFSIVTSQHIGRHFFVSFDLTVSSDYLTPLFDPETFSNRAFQFNSMAKADLGVGYRLPLPEYRSLRFYGKVENLFDRMYCEGGYRIPGATAIGGLQFEF